ncbi:MAG: SGNH/GDSL hydrolase family protein [Candidatus Izemoplasmatales bacterium]
MTTRVLFQGDSITDCNRFSVGEYGDGYVSQVVTQRPDLEIFNRGISGNKSSDLLDRWQEDTINLQPDILFIFVGVNDCWHPAAGHTTRPHTMLKEDYRKLLVRTKKSLPLTRIIMILPFLVVTDEFQKSFEPALLEVIEIEKELANEFGIETIELNSYLNQEAAIQGKSTLFWDGIHPTPKGHSLITAKVLEKLPF